MLFNKQKDLDTFLILWGILSVLGTLKVIQQFQFGGNNSCQKNLFML